MAVTLVNPSNRVIPRGITRFSWSTDYPQSAFEVQYKPVNGSIWQTFGRHTSALTAYDADLSKLTDFIEYYFRIIVYETASTVGTTIYTGNEKSAVFSLIVAPPGQCAVLRTKYGNNIIEVPIFSESNAPNTVKVSLDGESDSFIPLVSQDETMAVKLKTHHPNGIKAFVKCEATQFKYSSIMSETYMRIDTRNTNYSYYHATKYDRTYQIGYYITGYYYTTRSYVTGYYISGYSNRQYSYNLPGGCTAYSPIYYWSCGVVCTYNIYSCSGGHPMAGGGYGYMCGVIGSGTYSCYSNCISGGNCTQYSSGGTGYGYAILPSYAENYAYYRYQTPNYNPYYNYYRYYAYYKHTYYTYTTVYRYA